MKRINCMILEDFHFPYKNFCISISKCDLFDLFYAVASIYVLDFPEGQIDSSLNIDSTYCTGIWDDEMDDYSLSIYRNQYGKYELCFNQESSNYVLMDSNIEKQVYLDRIGLYELAKAIKKQILGFLDSKILFEQIKQLNHNLLWQLYIAPSIDLAINLKREGRYEL